MLVPSFIDYKLETWRPKPICRHGMFMAHCTLEIKLNLFLTFEIGGIHIKNLDFWASLENPGLSGMARVSWRKASTSSRTGLHCPNRHSPSRLLHIFIFPAWPLQAICACGPCRRGKSVIMWAFYISLKVNIYSGPLNSIFVCITTNCLKKLAKNSIEQFPKRPAYCPCS